MKGVDQPFLLPAVLFFLLLPLADRHAAAQEAFHQFANKDGQKIEARIVSVTPDWKTMKIRRKDGQEFDMAVNVLRLDDQQIVKEWIKANPAGARIDYNLEVEIEKKAKTAKNERDSFYKYKTMDVSYEIVIKNRTRQDLVGARADYVVIMENGVTIERSAGGRAESYSTSEFGEEGSTTYLRKSEELTDPLPFNHDHTFRTEAIQSEQVFGDGNVSYGEDKMLGVILRVIGPDDEVIGEYRSSESHVQKVTWDQVKGNAFGGGRSAPMTEDPEPVTSDTSEAPDLPEWLEVRKLEELPELLQKGDTIGARDLPRWGQKPVRITALVDINEEKTGGTIVACGGNHKGFAIFVLNDTLHFWVRRADDNNRSIRRGVDIPLSELPENQFKIAAEFKRDTLRLWIDDHLKAEGESFGLITYRPQEGLSVGYDSGDSAVGGAAPPHAFLGTVRDVRVQFGGSSFD